MRLKIKLCFPTKGDTIELLSFASEASENGVRNVAWPWEKFQRIS